MNSSGTTPLVLLLGVVLGGEGFVEYSVKLKVFSLGVLGRLAMPLPLTTTPFSISPILFPYERN